MDAAADEFTFPTVATSAARGPGLEGKLGRDDDPVAACLLPLPDLAAGASPLWPFVGSTPTPIPKTTTAPVPVTADDQRAPVVPLSGTGSSCSSERRAVPKEDHRDVAADEDRMDLLWEGTTTTTTTTSRSVTTTAPAPDATSVPIGYAHAGPPEQQRAAPDVYLDDDDKQRAAAVADAERMDKLWESFNEDPVLLRQHRGDRGGRRSKSAADHPCITVERAGLGRPPDDDCDHWYLCNYYSPSSDPGSDDDKETSASSPADAKRRGYGCAPTMLRASSRAGGAGQFCASPATGRRRRRSSGAVAGWALLLRLFRRLFAVDDAASSSHSHSSIYVP